MDKSPIVSLPRADEGMQEAHLFMIELTRLNGHSLVVNCDLIKFAEATPDTTLTLVTGERLIVRESCELVSERILHYHSSILRHAWHDSSSTGAISAMGAMHAGSHNGR